MRSWRGSGSPRGVMVMVIQRETEEFRASKTHSALVDQSYQFAVIQDIKGVRILSRKSSTAEPSSF